MELGACDCLRSRRASLGRGLSLSHNRRLQMLLAWFALRDGFPGRGALLCRRREAYLRFAVFLFNFDVFLARLTDLTHLFFVQI
jgi:hypothetical protein